MKIFQIEEKLVTTIPIRILNEPSDIFGIFFLNFFLGVYVKYFSSSYCPHRVMYISDRIRGDTVWPVEWYMAFVIPFMFYYSLLTETKTFFRSSSFLLLCSLFRLLPFVALFPFLFHHSLSFIFVSCIQNFWVLVIILHGIVCVSVYGAVGFRRINFDWSINKRVFILLLSFVNSIQMYMPLIYQICWVNNIFLLLQWLIACHFITANSKHQEWEFAYCLNSWCYRQVMPMCDHPCISAPILFDLMFFFFSSKEDHYRHKERFLCYFPKCKRLSKLWL